MAINLFTFPPNEEFDEEWRKTLEFVHCLELDRNRPDRNVLALGFVSDILERYEQKLVDQSPIYTEQAERISELASLAMRATRSFDL